MSQVNVNPSGTRSDGSAAASWSAATIAMLVGFLILILVLAYFVASQAGWMQPVTIIQQPAVERERTTVIDRSQAPAPQAPAPQAPVQQAPAQQAPNTTGGTGSTTGR